MLLTVSRNNTITLYDKKDFRRSVESLFLSYEYRFAQKTAAAIYSC